MMVHPAYAAAGVLSVPALFESLKSDPVRLELFLRAFPKGADLHNHLSGAVYAESFLKWAAQDGLCVSLTEQTILSKPCPHPAAGQIQAALLADNAAAWDKMVNALSMRHYVPTGEDRSGHDHFFATFLRFAVVDQAHQGDMLAEAANQAARDHVHYVELQIAPLSFPLLGEMMHKASLPPLKNTADLKAAYEALRSALGQMGALSRQAVDAMEARAHAVMQCGTSHAAAGCGVTIRYHYSILRIFPAPFVWTQLVAAYESVKQDARFVGVNIVAPEDDPIALRDYDLHMQMFHYLNQRYPGTHLSLHAGEVTPSLVPAADLDHHIREAIEVAGAERIGHGVDVLWERDPVGLLHEMAKRKILVEVNLTSNDEILSVKGARHPFPLYRYAGVPVALSTDDEGVSRSDLTQDYMRAVLAYHLDYPTLIQLSRTSLEYGFLPGESLWVGRQPGQIVPSCAGGGEWGRADNIASDCTRLLQRSLKAKLQWQLEAAFHHFEADIMANPLLTSTP
ncbi:MAG: adenosine deaminase [Bombella apis]|nr:adenosine deaminase [Bombella apis]